MLFSELFCGFSQPGKFSLRIDSLQNSLLHAPESRCHSVTIPDGSSSTKREQSLQWTCRMKAKVSMLVCSIISLSYRSYAGEATCWHFAYYIGYIYCIQDKYFSALMCRYMEHKIRYHVILFLCFAQIFHVSVKRSLSFAYTNMFHYWL